MDLTQGTERQKNERAKKMMLWFGIVSLLMGFAGWTSAYIISSKREDWIKDFNLPSLFYVSTAIILFSSITYFLAKNCIKKDKTKQGTLLLLLTLILGVFFIVFQFNGFSQMVAAGYYFTGPTSSIKMSYIFLIAMVHIVHVVVGLISLLVVLNNQIKGKYTTEDYLGVSLGETFWHFLGLLWVYLILFMSIVE